jgi:hypothetical protein
MEDFGIFFFYGCNFLRTEKPIASYPIFFWQLIKGRGMKEG